MLSITKKKTVIGVGLPKTGTTTLRKCLRMLGYRTGPYVGYAEASQRALHADRDGLPVRAEDWAFLQDYMAKYDVALDTPWWYFYQKLAKQYPDALFILTTRRDTETWLRSVISQENKADKSNKYALQKRASYGFPQIFGREQEHRDLYDQHNAAVRDFFQQGPYAFMDLCWESGHGWDELCSFLGVRKPWRSIPHKNRSASTTRHQPEDWATSFLGPDAFAE